MQIYESHRNSDFISNLMKGSMFYDPISLHRSLWWMFERLALALNVLHKFAIDSISEMCDSCLTLWKDSQQALKDEF